MTANALAYLDTNVIISFVETGNWDLVELFGMAAARRSTLVASDLTLAEVLVGPIKMELTVAVDVYKEFFVSDETLSVVPIDWIILIEAARVRAHVGNKLPDAIHVATASLHNCSIFVSDDKKIKLPKGMQRVPIRDLNGILNQ